MALGWMDTPILQDSIHSMAVLGTLYTSEIDSFPAILLEESTRFGVPYPGYNPLSLLNNMHIRVRMRMHMQCTHSSSLSYPQILFLLTHPY